MSAAYSLVCEHHENKTNAVIGLKGILVACLEKATFLAKNKAGWFS